MAAASAPNKGPEPAWKRWPPELIAEIEAVLKLNDAGRASVSARAMCERAQSAYGVKITRNQLVTAMPARFGRNGWARQ